MSGSDKPIVTIPTPVQPMVDGTGQVSVPWRGWFRDVQKQLKDMLQQLKDMVQQIEDILQQIQDILAIKMVTMQTGTSTSDGSGAIHVTLPVPWTLQPVSFVINAGVAHPGAYYDKGTTGSIALTTVTGMLMEVTTVGSPAVAVPSQPFTWFATGA